MAEKEKICTEGEKDLQRLFQSHNHHISKRLNIKHIKVLLLLQELLQSYKTFARTMKKIYEKVMGWFRGIGIDKYWHFIAGLVIAALFNIAFGLEVCILPVIAVAFLKEMYDTVVKLVPIDWWDLTATILGGLVVQVFVYL